MSLVYCLHGENVGMSVVSCCFCISNMFSGISLS